MNTPKTRVWYAPAVVWQHKSTVIAAFSILGILSHLSLRHGFRGPAAIYQAPLLATLVLGGLPLLFDLLRKLLMCWRCLTPCAPPFLPR